MNTTEAGLMRDILDNPDDDTPRLVYADWLMDYGDAERGEFIKVQIECYRRAHSGRRVDDEERAMRGREAELWNAKNQARWFGWFIRPPEPYGIEVARGFLDTLALDGRRFKPFPFDTIFTEHPLRAVRVNVGWDAYSQQISSAIPEELRYLELADCCQMTRSEATSLLSYSCRHGWKDTLEELAIEMGNAPALDMILAALPRVRVRWEGVLYPAEQSNGNRRILERPEIATVLTPPA